MCHCSLVLRKTDLSCRVMPVAGAGYVCMPADSNRTVPTPIVEHLRQHEYLAGYPPLLLLLPSSKKWMRLTTRWAVLRAGRPAATRIGEEKWHGQPCKSWLDQVEVTGHQHPLALRPQPPLDRSTRQHYWHRQRNVPAPAERQIGGGKWKGKGKERKAQGRNATCAGSLSWSWRWRDAMRSWRWLRPAHPTGPPCRPLLLYEYSYCARDRACGAPPRQDARKNCPVDGRTGPGLSAARSCAFRSHRDVLRRALRRGAYWLPPLPVAVAVAASAAPPRRRHWLSCAHCMAGTGGGRRPLSFSREGEARTTQEPRGAARHRASGGLRFAPDVMRASRHRTYLLYYTLRRGRAAGIYVRCTADEDR